MKLEKPEIHYNALDVMVNQIVGMTLEYNDVDIDLVWNTIKRSYLYKDLKYEDLIDVLNFLDSIRIIKYDKENKKILKAGKGLFYYIENLSMIPDEKSYDVIDITTGQKIGILHQEFVAKHGSLNTIFILRGLPWKIEKIDKKRILVSLQNDFESAIPSWEGEELPVPFEIAREGQEIKKELLTMDELKNQELYFYPDKNNIYIEQYKDWFIIHSPFGNKVNDSISRLLSEIISEKYGIVVGIKVDPYRILLKAGYLKKKDIKNIFENVNPQEIDKILEKAIVNTDLFLYKFAQVAKRFGVIRKDADYSRSTLRRISEHVLDTPVYRETINDIFIEKLDVKNTRLVFEKISKGEIKVNVVDKKTLSPLGITGLEEYVSDVLISDKWKEIMRLVKERILDAELTLVCMACKSQYKVKVKDYKEFKCKKCKGTYFGVAKNDRDIKDEKKLNITAELLKNYGKKFLFIYGARGISYLSAKFLVKKEFKDEDQLLMEIIEFEKRGMKFAKRR
ncbi:ATP-dependent helicase [Nanobdella aerobiophila]|uniref:ATP-dependent helicase n=1 Tax=Nanobdella aerobiophila TaxID=2586965 RepID=A0A915SKH1_9ARCH|nr:hypothetical protein [Nanobdella aerobiophila]BBL45331.1 ATP-dependent helicase [Nanobdella aerobiophila]